MRSPGSGLGGAILPLWNEGDKGDDCLLAQGYRSLSLAVLSYSTQVLITQEVPGTQPWAAPTRQLQRQPLNEWGSWGPLGQPRAQGLVRTMARPGCTVAEAWAAADGVGQSAGAKLGTKGPCSQPAGGCLHRCGSGGAFLPRAWGPGAGGGAGNSSCRRLGT